MKTYTIHDAYEPFEIKVGDEINDDLTSKKAKIKNITEDKNGNIGIWLEDESYLDGGRHPWDISKVQPS